MFANKDDFIKHYKGSKTRVRWGFGVDFAEQIPSFIHPEKQYRLNTKRWLAVCSLRSANDRILDPEGFCTTHKTKDGLWYYGSDCPDCKTAVQKEVANLKERLENTEPPFVLKLTQSLGSVGTMLVKNQSDKDETIKTITQTQTETLPFVTAENAHIYPASLVLSDFLPGETNALNFYVRGDGSVKFMGACHQLATRTTGAGKQHTALTWDHQDRLEKKFKDTLSDIGKVLHNEGYYGPCGADIMETEDGTQYVIDLNVRSSTSLILGCLKGHCEKRKFNACMVYECLLLNLSRGDLESKFEKEFEQGRLILLGNTRLGKKDKWAYPVVFAGEDQDAVKALAARILEFEATGGKDAGDAGGA